MSPIVANIELIKEASSNVKILEEGSYLVADVYLNQSYEDNLLSDCESNDIILLRNKFKHDLIVHSKLITGNEEIISTRFDEVISLVDELNFFSSNITVTKKSLFFVFDFKDQINVDLEIYHKDTIEGIQAVYSAFKDKELIQSNYGTIFNCVQEIKELSEENNSHNNAVEFVEEDSYDITIKETNM